jgi:hypothetical protein
MSTARHALIQALFHLTYEVTPKRPRHLSRSSYGLKHEFECAWKDRFYFSNSETIAALNEIGVPFYPGDPNVYYKIKPKFPLNWLRYFRRDAPRPKYEPKTKWAIFVAARTELDALLDELLKDTDPSDSTFTRLVRVIGYEGEVKEVPACLTARLTQVPSGLASGSP